MRLFVFTVAVFALAPVTSAALIMSMIHAAAVAEPAPVMLPIAVVLAAIWGSIQTRLVVSLIDRARENRR